MNAMERPIAAVTFLLAWASSACGGVESQILRGMESRMMEWELPRGPGYQMMGDHILMTELRAPTPQDSAEAWRRVYELREALEPYRDSDYAVRDGYRPFLAEVPGQDEYHFTNYRYAWQQAMGGFDPAKPTSLLYERRGDDYRLVGVMYTADADAALDELDRRVLLSMGQWHLHVNVCLPPRGRGDARDMAGPGARFGTRGSISTAEECEVAGGRFFPRVFNWMVHVYPYEEHLAGVFQLPAGHRDGHTGHDMMGGGHHGHH
ncbi:MAG: hypothetical protein ACREKN_05300 [Longimicrobiaceae bacterium]